MNNAQTIDLGNGESLSSGIFPQADGTFLALAFTRSKFFKTRKGAERWLARVRCDAPLTLVDVWGDWVA